jgi:hypothetical protein
VIGGVGLVVARRMVGGQRATLCALFPAGALHGVVPDIVIGTFGKALGGFGAFAATSYAFTDLLWNNARPLVFWTVAAEHPGGRHRCDRDRAWRRWRPPARRARAPAALEAAVTDWLGCGGCALSCCAWIATPSVTER